MLGGRWEGVGLASVEGRPGSLIYRQIKSLHCSGYLLVTLYYTILRVMLNYLKVTVVLCKRLVKVCYKLPLYN